MSERQSQEALEQPAVDGEMTYIPRASTLTGFMIDQIVKRFYHQYKLGFSAKTTYGISDSQFIPGLRLLTQGSTAAPELNGVIAGTVRMGYGHYRMALSIVSQALAQGITPYWHDFIAFTSAESSALQGVEREYSRGSKLSEKNALVDFLWERITGAGGWGSVHFTTRFAQLLVKLLGDLPRETPFISSHVFTAATAVQSGFKNVLQMIPDNTPMPFHVAPGALNLVQSPSMFSGYLAMGLPRNQLEMVGHYVDHELTANIDHDCDLRIERASSGQARRLLMSIGGAGAQQQLLHSILDHLRANIIDGKICVFLNCGDHRTICDLIIRHLETASIPFIRHQGWEALTTLLTQADGAGSEMTGLHIVLNEELLPAVLATNKLMRVSDVLITKPSELSFYPIPKLFLHRIGNHEAMGAIRGAELGEGTVECRNTESLFTLLDLLIHDGSCIASFCERIKINHRNGIYDGARRAIELALERRSRAND